MRYLLPPQPSRLYGSVTRVGTRIFAKITDKTPYSTEVSARSVLTSTLYDTWCLASPMTRPVAGGTVPFPLSRDFRENFRFNPIYYPIYPAPSLYLSFEIGDGSAGIILEDLPIEDLNVLRLGVAFQVV